MRCLVFGNTKLQALTSDTTPDPVTQVMICITDTAIAAKRPPGKLLYDTLVKLGEHNLDWDSNPNPNPCS